MSNIEHPLTANITARNELTRMIVKRIQDSQVLAGNSKAMNDACTDIGNLGRALDAVTQSGKTIPLV